MSTITREFLEEIIQHPASVASSGVIRDLARIALASLEAEPVAWTDADELRDAKNGGSGYLFSIGGDANKFADPRRQLILYTAPPAPVVPEGLRLALSNAGIAAPEGDEALFATSEKYVQMLVTWVKERKPFQSAPAVPDDGHEQFEEWMLQGWGRERREYDFMKAKFRYGENYADSYTRCMWKAWTASRTAILQGNPNTITLSFEQWLSQQTGKIDSDCSCVTTEVFYHWLRVAYESRNSPVIPDGYALVPVDPTTEMIAAAMNSDDVSFDKEDDTMFYVHHGAIWRAMLAAAPRQEVK